MKADSDDIERSTSGTKTRFYLNIVLCISLLVLLVIFLSLMYLNRKPLYPNLNLMDLNRKPSPPDLSLCTHLEINYTPSLKVHLLPPFGMDADFLSADENKEVQSLEKIIINDKKSIKTLARAISSGSFQESIQDTSPFGNAFNTYINCYQNDERIALISRYDVDSIVVDGKIRFSYKKDLQYLFYLAPESIRPFIFRIICGRKLLGLYEVISLAKEYQTDNNYPASNRWCDIILQDRSDYDIGATKRMRECLKCPTVRKGKCTYAMNPNCEPNSPPDMVLLFETKSGWNKHGGPKLFTFDNHEPKGGCVLLNDGTVKFVRTKEELRQLRWE